MVNNLLDLWHIWSAKLLARPITPLRKNTPFTRRELIARLREAVTFLSENPDQHNQTTCFRPREEEGLSPQYCVIGRIMCTALDDRGLDYKEKFVGQAFLELPGIKEHYPTRTSEAFIEIDRGFYERYAYRIYNEMNEEEALYKGKVALVYLENTNGT